MRRRPSLFLLFSFLLTTGCGLSHFCEVPPSVTGQPLNENVKVGDSAIFTVAATGYGALKYQWSKNSVVIPGANQPSYITPALSASDSGSTFTVTVSNSIGSVVSSAATLSVSSPASSDVRFVSPSGSDSNPGTIAQPYLTIQKCASSVSAGSTCEIRAGTYRETVTPNSGVTITAYQFEPVTVDGSDPVTGWTSYQGSIYEANVNLSADDTNQVFVGAQMMTEARWPNANDLFHVNWATARPGTDSGHIVDSNLPPKNWTGAKIHLWSGSDPFGNETGQVIASSTGRMTIDVGQTGTCPSICPQSGGFYYLFGTLAALDAQNEWFYDSGSATLYFMPPGGSDPNMLDVRAKQRQYAFDLRGKTGVTVSNISIFASTIVTDQYSSNNTLDRINAQYVSHFTTLPAAASDPGGGGFSILYVHETDSGIILNGTGNTLRNSTITYSAGAGVAVEGSNNTVTNNLIQDIDYIGDYASGADLDGDGNTIEYNTMQSTGRQAIYLTAVTNQNIGYNNLYSSMMLSRDGAAIYACCDQMATGTRIHHNWIHETLAVVKGTGDDNALSAIGFDNGSGGFEVDQNVFWNNQLYSVAINGVTGTGPNNTTITNNTIPDDSLGGVIRVNYVSSCASTRVIDNQVAVGVQAVANGSACTVSNNRPSAPGATEMTSASEVGCNFAGCSTARPPQFLSGGSISPCTVIDTAQPSQ